MSTTSTCSMDVDPPAASEHDRILKVHPLALIGISDHHTRISMGGSNLPPDSPTIGLLYGHTTSAGAEISIVDAEEVETSANPSTLQESQLTHIRIKIELHQKVFPNHKVVGWYRVRGSEGIDASSIEDVLPTPEDLQIHNGWMRDLTSTNNDGDGDSSPINPIFALMDATEKKHEPIMDVKIDSAASAAETAATPGEQAREKLDRDEELPLTLYDTVTNANAFVNVDFSLETFEPERIAVEHVFHTQPPAIAKSAASTSTRTTNDESIEEAPAVSTQKESAASQSQSPPTSTSVSAAEAHLQAVITSIDAMNARVAILLDFLHKTRDGVIAPNHSLLRQVMSLMKQLPIMKGSIMSSGRGPGCVVVQKNSTLEGEFKEEQDDMLVMAYLASLAKTTKAVVGYSDKFRLVVDSNGGVGGSGTASSGGGGDTDRHRRGGRDNPMGMGF